MKTIRLIPDSAANTSPSKSTAKSFTPTTPNKTNTSCMQKILQYVPVFLGIVAVGFSLILYFVRAIEVPYWISFSVWKIGTWPIWCVFIGLLVLVIIQRLQGRRDSIRLSLISLFAATLAVGIACTASIPILLTGGINSYRVDIQLQEKRYYVESNWKPGVGSVYLSAFLLVECNADGMDCQTVHQKNYKGISLHEYERMPIRLIPDSAANTLALEINGEIVYTHHTQ